MKHVIFICNVFWLYFYRKQNLIVHEINFIVLKTKWISSLSSNAFILFFNMSTSWASITCILRLYIFPAVTTALGKSNLLIGILIKNSKDRSVSPICTSYREVYSNIALAATDQNHFHLSLWNFILRMISACYPGFIMDNIILRN